MKEANRTMTDIKTAVQQKYGQLATAGAGCCDSGVCCADTGGRGTGDCCASSGCCGTDGAATTRLVEYGALGEGLVEGADLGLGCGLPTRHAELRPGDTVLDLGSGAGVDVFLAARAVGAAGRVIGVDMTPEMIARARANAEAGGYPNVEFRLGEIEDLPVEDDSVDVVLSNCVINLVPDKARVFGEIHRVLRPGGGRFTISDVVSYGEVPAAIRQDIEQWTGCIAGAMDRDAYLALIGAAGFDAVAVRDEVAYDYLKGEGYGLASITVEGRKA